MGNQPPPKYWQTPKFKQAQKKWYARLEDKGFDDIEDTSSPHEMLKRWDNSYFSRLVSPEEMEARLKYYTEASRLLEDFKFEKEFDKKVWGLHCEGFSRRDIVKKLKSTEHKVRKVLQNMAAMLKAKK